MTENPKKDYLPGQFSPDEIPGRGQIKVHKIRGGHARRGSMRGGGKGNVADRLEKKSEKAEKGETEGSFKLVFSVTGDL